MADQKLSEKTVQSTVPSGTSKIYIVVGGQDRQMNADLMPISTEAQTLIDDNTSNTATNSGNIATNTSNIAINTASITTLNERTNSNLPSQVIQTPDIDWTGDVQENERIWTAVNAGTGPILIANNTQLHYRTKRVVNTEIASQDNYDLIINTWREQRRYATSGVVTVGTGGNFTLSNSNSLLYLDNTETYKVVDGTITNGFVQNLGDIGANTISEAVNALPTSIDSSDPGLLIIDDSGKQWIYIGQKEVIGNGVTTDDTEYKELTPQNSDPAPEYSLVNKTTYLTLSNVTDLRELVRLQNNYTNDTAIISNYLNDVVTFRYVNNGWQRLSSFNVGCGVRVDETTDKFSIIEDENHAPIGARYVVTDPLGTGAFQFALAAPNADKITGVLKGTADESDGLRGYTIGGSIDGRIGIMRVSATNGFSINVVISNGVVSFESDANSNVPSSYFTHTFDTATGIITINHPDIVISRNMGPTISLREKSNSGHPVYITDFTSTSVSYKLNTSVAVSIDQTPSVIIRRNGTYIVPIDLMKNDGNYLISGRTRSTERIYGVAFNITLPSGLRNYLTFDQTFNLTDEFVIEFGFGGISTNTLTRLIYEIANPNTNYLGWNGTSPLLMLNNTPYGGSSALNVTDYFDDVYIRFRRDANNDIYIKTNDNDEELVGNSSATLTLDRMGGLSDSQNGTEYIRTLRIGNEYYNFSEQTGLTGESVYNSGSNPRTFTLTQEDVNVPMWLEF